MEVAKLKKWTRRGLVAAVLIVGVWDLFVVWVSGLGSGATVSKVTGLAAVDAPAIVFVVGFIAGHIFWPQRLKAPPAP